MIAVTSLLSLTSIRSSFIITNFTTHSTLVICVLMCVLAIQCVSEPLFMFWFWLDRVIPPYICDWRCSQNIHIVWCSNHQTVSCSLVNVIVNAGDMIWLIFLDSFINIHVVEHSFTDCSKMKKVSCSFVMSVCSCVHVLVIWFHLIDNFVFSFLLFTY